MAPGIFCCRCKTAVGTLPSLFSGKIGAENLFCGGFEAKYLIFYG